MSGIGLSLGRFESDEGDGMIVVNLKTYISERPDKSWAWEGESIKHTF